MFTNKELLTNQELFNKVKAEHLEQLSNKISEYNSICNKYIHVNFTNLKFLYFYSQSKF